MKQWTQPCETKPAAYVKGKEPSKDASLFITVGLSVGAR